MDTANTPPPIPPAPPVAKPKFIYQWFLSPLATYEKGMFIFKTTAENPRYADLNNFGQQLANIYADFDSRGYDVLNVVPIATGGADNHTGAGYGGGGGGAMSAPLGDGDWVSVTRGAMIIGKLRE
jgi:hypothetical protein